MERTGQTRGARALACRVHNRVNALVLTRTPVFAGVRTRHGVPGISQQLGSESLLLNLMEVKG